MQFLYLTKAGDTQIEISDAEHRYITKVRRHKLGDEVCVRNLKDNIIYKYAIDTISKKTALLSLVSSEILEIKPQKKLHIGWCIIDAKSIEKTLPMLNEIGVEKITFIMCERSQGNFTLDNNRVEKILINSSQQCGRSEMMQIAYSNSLKEFVCANPRSFLLNFSQNNLTSSAGIETIVIGCEGGITKEEIALFSHDKIVGFSTNSILRSESAAVSAASNILL